MAAVLAAPEQDVVLNESNWSQESEGMTGYMRSKIIVEKVIWKFIESDENNKSLSPLTLTSLVPAAIFRPITKGGKLSESLQLVHGLLSGDMKEILNYTISLTHVVQLAEANRKAMEIPEALNERIIIAKDEPMSFIDAADLLRDTFPKFANKVPTKATPPLFAKRGVTADKCRKVLALEIFSIEKDDYIVTYDGTNDPFHPHNLPLVKKLIYTGVIGLSAFSISLGSAIKLNGMINHLRTLSETLLKISSRFSNRYYYSWIISRLQKHFLAVANLDQLIEILAKSNEFFEKKEKQPDQLNQITNNPVTVPDLESDMESNSHIESPHTLWLYLKSAIDKSEGQDITQNNQNVEMSQYGDPFAAMGNDNFLNSFVVDEIFRDIQK